MSNSIEQTASRLRWLVLVCWAILAVVYVAARLKLGAGSIRFETHVGGSSNQMLLGDLSMILLSVALLRLVQMLSAISASLYFSVPAVRAFRSFALWLFLVALLWIGGPIASELVREDGGAQRSYAFRVDVSDLLTVAITLILLLVARLLERARLIEEDMREII